ncbi:MAG: hypothetical protein C0402_12160 [Thermodesulfovibrio sp.]|nr:hypothetical protein [Thermodesulfovibrio sp.]
MKIKTIAIMLVLVCAITSQAYGSDIESRLSALEEIIKQQGKTINDQQMVILELKEELQRSRKEEIARSEEKVVEVDRSQKATGLFGTSNLMNPNISLILDTFGYSSNLKESELRTRRIPGYTTEGITNRKGINLDSAELFFFAPVDPYFNLYATIPITEDGVELEEAYFVTTSLPYGLQLKGGKFKSGFGRINSQHPHAWDFADAPLSYRALMGGEGITDKGVQLTYLPTLPFYTLFGVELLQGDNLILFGPDARSGPHAFTAFAKASFDVSDNATILFGPSVISGSTKTDTIADNTDFRGRSTLYGFEATYKWKPSKAQSVTLQSEYLYRSQTGTLEDSASSSVDGLKRKQDGLYIQGVYQWERYRAGLRYDVLDLFKKDYMLSGNQSDFGSRPWRVSGMLEFKPTEFSRIRLQYNHDKSARNSRANNEVILQLTFGIGAHGAHPF